MSLLSIAPLAVTMLILPIAVALAATSFKLVTAPSFLLPIFTPPFSTFLRKPHAPRPSLSSQHVMNVLIHLIPTHLPFTSILLTSVTLPL